MDGAKPRAWAGIDAGEGFHRVVVPDAEGGTLLSRKVDNSEEDLSALIGEALAFGRELVWAIDQPGGPAALPLALLWGGASASSTSPASPWTGRATPAAASPAKLPTASTPASSPSRPA